MNNFLADLLGLINGVLAFLVVILGAVGGAFYRQEAASLEFNLLGAILGGGAGVLVAAVTFGALAILISIRKELRQLNRAFLKPRIDRGFS